MYPLDWSSSAAAIPSSVNDADADLRHPRLVEQRAREAGLQVGRGAEHRAVRRRVVVGGVEDVEHVEHALHGGTARDPEVLDETQVHLPVPIEGALAVLRQDGAARVEPSSGAGAERI